MPSFPLVQGLVESYLKRGINRAEAEEIVRYVADERADKGELTGTQREQLNRVIALYGDFFTPTAKRAFERMADDFDTRRFASGDTVGRTGELNSPVKMRAALLSEREAIDERFDLVKKGKRPKVTIHELDFEELLGREPDVRAKASLTHDEAFALKLHGDNLLAGLEFPESTAVASVLAELEHLERTIGDNDGKLAPRDLKDVSASTAIVMNALYGASGKRLLALSTIKKRLPAAIFEVINDKRNRDGLRPLFTLVAEDAINCVAAGYEADVQKGAQSLTRFFEQLKISSPAEKGDWTERLYDLVAPPTLDEIDALYGAATSGKLQVREFYTAARIDKRDLFQLQARLPERFARPDELKQGTALAAPKASEVDVVKLATAWNLEAASGDKTVEAFARDHGVKLNVLTRARKENPELFRPLPARQHTARIEGRLDAFVDALERAMDAAPFEKVRGLLAIVNADPAFRSAHDEVTYQDYYSFRRSAKSRFSRVDSSDRWMSAVEVTLRELMAKPGADDLSRKALVTKLKKTWPKMTYSRLSHMLEWNPDLPIPGRRGKRSGADIDKIADEILKLMKRDPGRTQASITRALKKAGHDVTDAYVNAVIRDYRPTLFTQFNRVQERRLIARRTSLPSRQLLSMCIRTSAPGTKADVLLDKYNALLEERGLPPHKKSDAPRLKDLVEPFEMKGPNDHFAEVLTRSPHRVRRRRAQRHERRRRLGTSAQGLPRRLQS